MGNLNYIVFGGVDSRDYGIYISGEGVFNAPERDVEVVNIPGKDGDLLIDRGRFLNIQVTYPGFNFEPDLSTFAERLRAFRAALASQIGYQRLEDSFHPDEFRLASFRSGLDVNPVMYNTASTFDIVFNCKPQRFLKSGEEEITIGEWGETQTASGSIATFEAESNTGIKSLVANIEPIQSGSGDPSPSNIRSISGYDTVNVTRCGKNLLDPNKFTKNGNTSARFYLNDGLLLKGGVPYVLTYKGSDNLSALYFKTSNGATILNYVYNAKKLTYTPTEDTLVSVDLYLVNGIPNIDDMSNYQLEIGTESTAYEPYQGSSYSIPLGQTVYGGTLDLISGVLTIDRGYAEFDGSSDENWQRWTSGSAGAYAMWIGIPDAYTNGIEITFSSNYLKPILGTDTWGNYDSFISSNGVNNIKTGIRNITTIESWREYLASNPLQVVYELVTPITYQLTPEQIETLLGVNNIWADTGDVSVEIGEDPNILVNPSPFEALPLIEVVGVGSLTVGNITVTITGESTQDIFIDSDIMEAYEDDNGAIISRNDRISLSGMNFPTLGTDTGITYTGLTSVTVTPRWWTI